MIFIPYILMAKHLISRNACHCGRFRILFKHFAMSSYIPGIRHGIVVNKRNNVAFCCMHTYITPRRETLFSVDDAEKTRVIRNGGRRIALINHKNFKILDLN